MRATLRVFALALAVWFALAAPARTLVSEHWAKELNKSSAALKNGEWERSLKITNRLIGDMLERLGPGETATRLFAQVVTQKAIAHSGLGQKDDALWYWHVAISLYPAFADASDLSEFGEAGRFLIENRELRKQTVRRETREREELAKDITPPRVLKQVRPQFPGGAMAFATAGRIEIEVVISKEGVISSPRIEKTLPAPTLAYATLEAVRRWRFEPGKLEGKPVDVIFNLTVNYKL